MPHSLPQRSGGFRDYEKDAPITVFGCTQARLVGKSPFAGMELLPPHLSTEVKAYGMNDWPPERLQVPVSQWIAFHLLSHYKWVLTIYPRACREQQQLRIQFKIQMESEEFSFSSHWELLKFWRRKWPNHFLSGKLQRLRDGLIYTITTAKKRASPQLWTATNLCALLAYKSSTICKISSWSV